MRKYGALALFGGLVATTFTTLAHAQVIDTFDAGNGTFTGCGLPSYSYFAGAGPIGERRELYMRDGHSSCFADITIDTGNGTVEFWSNVTGAEQHLLYGTFIGTLYPGFGVPSSNSGLPLNISLTTADAIEVDVENMPVGPGLGITLKTGSGDFTWNGSPTVGTNRILLSEFSGLTDAAAADIDGIHVSSGVNGAQGTGIILSEIRFVALPHAGLVRQTSLLAGDANCSAGGVQIDTGLDNGQGDGTADDNVLDDDEVDSTSYVCNGVAGEDGQDGANGADGEDGVDGVNGADGLTALLRQTTEVPGLNCAAGGIRVDTGLDDGAGLGTANDEILDDDEVDSTLYVCNGVAGEDGQDGANGADGEDGQDGANGADGEDGVNGTDGEDGNDGFSSLITTTALSAGDPSCDAGGIRIDVGLDNGDNAGTARDSILQSGEIDQTSYVCNGVQGDAGVNGTNGEDGLDGKNGEAGIDGQNGTDGEDGADGKDGAKGKDGAPGSAVARFTRIEEGLECEAGGVLIEAGPDSNANGQLDDDEVQAESKLCTLHSTGGSGCTVSEGQAPTSGNWAGALTLLTATLVFRRRRSS